MTDEQKPKGNDDILREKGVTEDQLNEMPEQEKERLATEQERVEAEAPVENELGTEHAERPPVEGDSAE